MYAQLWLPERFFAGADFLLLDDIPETPTGNDGKVTAGIFPNDP